MQPVVEARSAIRGEDGTQPEPAVDRDDPIGRQLRKQIGELRAIRATNESILLWIRISLGVGVALFAISLAVRWM